MFYGNTKKLRRYATTYLSLQPVLPNCASKEDHEQANEHTEHSSKCNFKQSVKPPFSTTMYMCTISKLYVSVLADHRQTCT